MVDELRSLKANLEETLNEFRRQFFGVKSEKTSQKQTPDSQNEKKTVTVKAHTRERKPKATRDELYADLPIREIICRVPESQRHCDWCNTEMEFVTSKFVREEIRITPAKVGRETMANWCIIATRK